MITLMTILSDNRNFWTRESLSNFKMTTMMKRIL
jgi:hypothetical protein